MARYDPIDYIGGRKPRHVGAPSGSDLNDRRSKQEGSLCGKSSIVPRRILSPAIYRIAHWAAFIGQSFLGPFAVRALRSFVGWLTCGQCAQLPQYIHSIEAFPIFLKFAVGDARNND